MTSTRDLPDAELYHLASYDQAAAAEWCRRQAASDDLTPSTPRQLKASRHETTEVRTPRAAIRTSTQYEAPESAAVPAEKGWQDRLLEQYAQDQYWRDRKNQEDRRRHQDELLNSGRRDFPGQVVHPRHQWAALDTERNTMSTDPVIRQATRTVRKAREVTGGIGNDNDPYWGVPHIIRDVAPGELDFRHRAPKDYESDPYWGTPHTEGQK